MSLEFSPKIVFALIWKLRQKQFDPLIIVMFGKKWLKSYSKIIISFISKNLSGFHKYEGVFFIYI